MGLQARPESREKGTGLETHPTIEGFTDDELKTVISLLAGPGVVWELGFGSWILLQPELINSHAQAVIRSLREDEREFGCIAETQVLSGDLAFPKENPRLEPGEGRALRRDERAPLAGQSVGQVIYGGQTS